MSTSVTFNGTSYTVPAIADASWGTNVSNYLIAIASGCLQKTGGAFTLSQADVDFGATYGLKAVYFKSKTANIASAGVVQLARTDVISWRNQANGADLSLSVDSSNNLSFNGALLVNLALGAAYTILQMNSGGTAYSWATPTGTGAPVLANTPTLITPVLGVATATSINKMAITAPATSSTLAVADGKTATFSNTLTFAGTDGKTLTISNSLTFTGTDGNSFAFPSGSSTVMTLASVDTITGAKSFNDAKLIMNGSSSGAMTLKAPAAASTYIATFFAATDTVMGLTFQQTATNKIWSDSTVKFGNVSDTTKALLFSLGGATTAKTMTLISSHTNDRSITFPDATDTLMGKATTDAITNKDFQGATASNSSRITVPSAATATLSGLTRKQGTIVYDTTLNQLFSDDGTNLNPVGSGAGEKNYVSTGTSNSGGWAVSGAGVTAATDTTTADLPRSITSKSGILISRVSGSSDYAYYRFTLDPADYNTLLKIQFAMKPGGSFVASDFKVDMYSNTASNYGGSSTRIALSTDSSAVTALPNLTGTYRTAFGATNATAPYMELRIGLNASTSGTTLCISDVIVGPGIVIQGAAISEWTSYTPTGAWSTNTTYTGFWRRVGSSMELAVKVATAGAPTSATLTVNLPTGYTINTAAIPDTTANIAAVFGNAVVGDSGTNSYSCQVKYSSTSAVRFQFQSNASGIQSDVTQAAPITFGSGDFVEAFFKLPINEWTGSGTLNVAQNDVEYVYNSSSATTGDDSTSFAYGPIGVAIPSITASGLRRVRFLTPIQPSDLIQVEVDADGSGRWSVVGNANMQNSTGRDIDQYRKFNSVSYGIGAPRMVNATDLDVNIGTYRSTADAATYSGTGSAWSTVSGARWRVKKIAGGQAVGFANVAQSTSGLVKSAGQLLGTNTNDSAATGYVGEYLSTTASSVSLPTTANYTDTGNLSLTAGDWDITHLVYVVASGSNITDIVVGISTTSGNSSTGLTAGDNLMNNSPPASSGQDISESVPSYRVSISATTTYYGKFKPRYSGGTPTYSSRLSARRIR